MNLPYTSNRFKPSRRITIPVRAGDCVIGGNCPILIQSMTNTPTQDIEATVNQVLKLDRAGCGLVRITAPSVKDAQCLREISARSRARGAVVPLSADIHFNPKAAFEAVKWVEKVRVNPGNFSDKKPSGSYEFTVEDFKRGEQKVYDDFAPLVRQARQYGRSIRIGVNHGSLSARMLYKFGDTVEGMVESALEYLRVCEAEGFDQVVFSMKASNPRISIYAYRLLAARLQQGHSAYPFHLGVTEAGDGRDGRLKSAVGIGALLLDGLGDTIRVSLTEDPVEEIPVARQLISVCSEECNYGYDGQCPVEAIDFYHYCRRPADIVDFSGLQIGDRHNVAAGTYDPGSELPTSGDRPLEWAALRSSSSMTGLSVPFFSECGSVSESALPGLRSVCLNGSPVSQALIERAVDIRSESIQILADTSAESLKGLRAFWSMESAPGLLWNYRYLAAWLARSNNKAPILIRLRTQGTSASDMLAAAQAGALLCDGIGDLLLIDSVKGAAHSLDLTYDILQASKARRSKTEYVSCPGCGRTLFELSAALNKIRDITGHLGNVSIAVMGCIVNGPGEMADADFGYVGGAAGKVDLYEGRTCVKKGVPQADAPGVLVDLIKQAGKWREP